jgi:hypothetical protein
MKFTRLLFLVGGLAVLAACGTVAKPAPPEPMGEKFSVLLRTLTATGDKFVVAIRTADSGGKLKVCGLYMLAGGANSMDILQQGMSDRSSLVIIKPQKDNKGVNFIPSFLIGYLREGGANASSFPDPKESPVQFVKVIKDLRIPGRTAGCITTDEPWRAEFAQADIEFYLNKTTYTYTYQYTPAVVRRR